MLSSSLSTYDYKYLNNEIIYETIELYYLLITAQRPHFVAFESSEALALGLSPNFKFAEWLLEIPVARQTLAYLLAGY